MTNLKPCPCGKTPTKVIEDTHGVYGDCCYVWTSSVIGYSNKEERWNSAPRAVPIPCPAECDHGRLPDVDAMTAEQFLAALKRGDEVPTIPCPTCAPFGGRGAIMVEEGHQQPEGEA